LCGDRTDKHTNHQSSISVCRRRVCAKSVLKWTTGSLVPKWPQIAEECRRWLQVAWCIHICILPANMSRMCDQSQAALPVLIRRAEARAARSGREACLVVVPGWSQALGHTQSFVMFSSVAIGQWFLHVFVHVFHWWLIQKNPIRYMRNPCHECRVQFPGASRGNWKERLATQSLPGAAANITIPS